MARLTSASVDYPQTVFTSFTKSLQSEWSFVQRVLLGYETGFSLIKEAIRNEFLPTSFSIYLSEQGKDSLCRPTHFAGLGIFDPVQTARWQYENSRAATDSISIALKSGNNLDLDSYHANSRDVTKNKNVQEKQMQTDTQNLINQFSVHQKRVISRKLDFKCSGWLLSNS